MATWFGYFGMNLSMHSQCSGFFLHHAMAEVCSPHGFLTPFLVNQSAPETWRAPAGIPAGALK
jgi:hypothetical protein